MQSEGAECLKDNVNYGFGVKAAVGHLSGIKQFRAMVLVEFSTVWRRTLSRIIGTTSLGRVANKLVLLLLFYPYSPPGFVDFDAISSCR